MRCKKILLSAIAVILLSACQNSNTENLFSKENIGAATGAIGGAWIGSNVGKGKGNIAAIAAGTLLGGYLGKSIGASLDRADMAYYHQASQNALENSRSGVSSTWSNPDNGHRGSITPTRTYRNTSGSHCREYQQTVTIDGRTEQAYGTACRQNDGTWKITQ